MMGIKSEGKTWTLRKLCAVFIDGFVVMMILQAIFIGIYFLFGKKIIDEIMVGDPLISTFALMFYYQAFYKSSRPTLGKIIFRVKGTLPGEGRLLKREFDFPEPEKRNALTLEVTSQDGIWICPSCEEHNREFQDTCRNCGQEIEKAD